MPVTSSFGSATSAFASQSSFFHAVLNDARISTILATPAALQPKPLIQPGPSPAQKPVEVEPPKESAAQKQARETEELQKAFHAAVVEYCKVRNEQAKKIDVLRELRGEAEQSASVISEGWLQFIY